MSYNEALGITGARFLMVVTQLTAFVCYFFFLYTFYLHLHLIYVIIPPSNEEIESVAYGEKK